MTTAHLIALLGAGCAASSLIAWLAAINPLGAAVGKAIYCGLFLCLILGLLLDDVMHVVFKLTVEQYYGLLAFVFLAILMGGGLVWLSA
ncbi:MAG: hypothetical protein HC895_11555 [Leptolyngbyaceae cyanobacterium SM1_3_5]|nr:hypothetical protein [Leptolyngbyaceae cyanobacterium SM1_3_5]